MATRRSSSSSVPAQSDGAGSLERLDQLEQQLAQLQAEIDGLTLELAKEDPTDPAVIALAVRQAARYTETTGADGLFNCLWAEFGRAIQENSDTRRAVEIFATSGEPESDLASACGFGIVVGLAYSALTGFELSPPAAPLN